MKDIVNLIVEWGISNYMKKIPSGEDQSKIKHNVSS